MVAAVNVMESALKISESVKALATSLGLVISGAKIIGINKMRTIIEPAAENVMNNPSILFTESPQFNPGW